MKSINISFIKIFQWVLNYKLLLLQKISKQAVLKTNGCICIVKKKKFEINVYYLTEFKMKFIYRNKIQFTFVFREKSFKKYSYTGTKVQDKFLFCDKKFRAISYSVIKVQGKFVLYYKSLRQIIIPQIF